MNKATTTIIIFGAFLGLAFSLFVGQAFAAGTITPVSVSAFGETGVTLRAHTSGVAWTTVPAWFAYGTTPNPDIVVGDTRLFGSGTAMLPFETTISNLTPGTTYYFRANVMVDGVTVQSSVATFTVPVKNAPVTPIVVTPVVTTPKAPVAVAPKETPKAPVATQTTPQSELILNSQSGAVIGAGESVLPGTLIGWVGLMLMVLIIMLMVTMLVESVQRRRFEHELALEKARAGTQEYQIA